MEEIQKTDKNPHAGHRQRLIDKFLANPELLSNHELVELMLFYAIPHKNVNTEAHELINKFGSVTNVLNADEKELQLVDGIGKNSAAFIKLIKRLSEVLTEEKVASFKLYSYENARNLLINLYKNADKEVFTAFYLNKQEKIINRQTFTSDSKNSVSFTLDELGRGLYANKPYAVVIAHNHCSGFAEPSYNDDKTTEKLYMLFQLNGVNFYDHIIVADDKTFSYRFDGNRLDKIKNEVNKKLF